MPDFGWRKRIGFISPTVMEVIAYDFYRMAPEGVGLVGITCNIEGWARDQYEAGLAQVDRAAEYLASRKVDFIIHGGGPLVVSRGPGFDRELVERIERLTGTPATTTIRSALEALEHLGIKKVTLASNYPEDLNQEVAAFLQHYGFTVVHTTTLDLSFKQLQDVSTASIYRFITSASRAAPEADGIYMPCGQWPVSEAVDVAERDIGKPVVASNAANFWTAFRRLGLRDRITGHGRLLASLAEERPAPRESVPA